MISAAPIIPEYEEVARRFATPIGSPKVLRCRGHLWRENGQWKWAVRWQCGAAIHEPSGEEKSGAAACAASKDAILPTYQLAA
jgi:hypothetical protein